MKILHVLGSLERGGAELRTLELQRELKESGISFDYVCLSGEEGSLAGIARAMGSEVYPVRTSTKGLLEYLRIVRDGKYDVVQSHVATASGLMLLIAMIGGAPRRIAHFRSDGDSRPSSPLRQVQRWIGRRLIGVCATSVVGVSPGALKFAGLNTFEKSRLRRVAVLPNGIIPAAVAPYPLRKELGIPRDAKVILNVGKPTVIKRRSLAAEAALSTPNAHIVFVGPSGPDIEDVAAIASAGNRSRMHILGVRDDVRKIMAASDVLLLPSTVEGLPGVALESLSVGTPVVASQLSGAEYISATVKGITMVETHASTHEWTRALSGAMLSTCAMREGIKQSFLDSQFTLESSCLLTKNIYSE